MTLEYCKDCKYCVRMIAIALGVRCRHDDHRISARTIPTINEIKDCKLREER